MALLLRVLRNKNKWLEDRPEWLTAEAAPADTLSCLQTQSNALSVYSISTDRANLARVLAAHAATRDNVDKLDYALFDESKAKEKGCLLLHTPGTTSDGVVNACHLDIEKLCVSQLAVLAEVILSQGDFERLDRDEVSELLGEALRTKNIEIEKVKSRIRPELEALTKKTP